MECIKCGNCCRARSIDITFSDVLRWHEQKRRDILKEISFIDNFPHTGQGGFYIEKSLKKKGDLNRHCPFLTSNNECSIHDTKPSGCSDAPYAYETFDECPVFVRSPKPIIRQMVEKQSKDIMAAKHNFNIVMNIIVEARNWQT